MLKQLFTRKPLSLLQKEIKTQSKLKRVLGPASLTALGIGCVIGAGIFVLTGIVAHDKTGPAIMLSFVVSGTACIFAALCYAEFAAMAPVSGSAYTYAYASLGELFAWIIGWDLILEYTVASATVAHGWSHYLQDMLGIFNIKIPHIFTNAPFDFVPATGSFAATGTWLDLPAILITLAITWIMVKGIRESANFNAVMVAIKIAVVLFVIGVGAFYVNPANWHPFAPFGWGGLSFFGHTLFGQVGAGGQPLGMLAGAAMIFLLTLGLMLFPLRPKKPETHSAMCLLALLLR
jgi:APA family basic amino acid/polyamine antiporter